MPTWARWRRRQYIFFVGAWIVAYFFVPIVGVRRSVSIVFVASSQWIEWSVVFHRMADYSEILENNVADFVNDSIIESIFFPLVKHYNAIVEV